MNYNGVDKMGYYVITYGSKGERRVYPTVFKSKSQAKNKLVVFWESEIYKNPRIKKIL